jgi:hypothetical protein
MQNTLRSFTFLFLAAALLAGCSKDDNSPSQTQPSPPSLPSVVFKGPSSTSNNAGLIALQTYIANANSLAISIVPFAFVTPVYADGSWKWTLVNKTLTMALTAVPQVDNSNAWTLYFDGVDPADSVRYNHWLAVQGTTSADGKNGNGKAFAANTTVITNGFNWVTTNNVLTGTLTPYVSGAVSGQTVIINNPDNSGEFRMYMGSVLIYKAAWQSNGSGTWWSYDLNGVQTGTGGWS